MSTMPASEVGNNGEVAKRSAEESSLVIGSRIRKFFPDHGWFIGTVVSVQDDLWHVLYHDGDEEDMELKEIQSLIIAEGNTNAKKCKLSVENEKQKVIKPLWTVQGIDPALFRPLQGVPNSKEMAQFYLFMYERQRIWERRSRGDPKPWSKNTIMETIHFCNVYRELDRGTAYFRSLLLDMPPAKNQREWTHKVLWMSYCYRQVNRVDSLQKTGLPEEDNLKPFFQKMRNDFQQTKQAFFTEAHQTTQYAKLEMHLRHTAGRLDPLVSVICDAESTLKDIHKALRGLRGIGKFLAWQIICDLQEGGCLAVDENFAVMGPGAKQGLDLIYKGSQIAEMNIAADPALVQARILTALQDPIFETLGLQFPYWKGKRLTLKEIEHALCEYSKYHRLENDPTSVGSRVKREYKSRSYLDIDKACLGCKDSKRDGIFCDMCNSFFCDSCKTSVKEEEEESWSCYRCTAFDNRRHFTKVIKAEK